MNERKFLYKVCKDTEKKFNVICYAYKTALGSQYVWNICVNDYELYSHDAEFKDWRDNIYLQAKELSIKISFCFCNPKEENLWELAQNNNLILVISK
jgi:hypothetical protein